MQVTLSLCSADEAKINELVKLHNSKYPDDQIDVVRAIRRLFYDGLYVRRDTYPELYAD